MVNIGKRIKSARQKAGMSQEELAQSIGATKSAVSRYEAGKRQPSYDQLQRIAKVLGVSIYELFDGSMVDEDGAVHIWPAQQPEVVVHDEPIQAPKVVVHEDPPAEMEVQAQRWDMFNDLLSSWQLKKTLSDLFYGSQALTQKSAEDEGLTAEDFGLAESGGLTAEDLGLGDDEIGDLFSKLQDGKPLVLSPEELAKLKDTPKEQIAAALDKTGGVLPPPQASEMEAHGIRLYCRPSEHPELDYLIQKSQAGTITPRERERMDELFATVRMEQEREKQLCELAPPPSAHTRLTHSLGVSHIARDMMGQLCGPQHRIAAALDKLNDEGQEKVATYAEDLVEMPKYQAQEPPTAPAQDTPPAPEGTDTTPEETPPEAPQEPPEGRITSITMICPICGMTLRGDPATGKAHCRYCNRSFPLPKKARGPFSRHK